MHNFSYGKLFVTVLFSVLIANISAGVIFKYWISYETEVALEEAAAALNKATKENKRRLAIQSYQANQTVQKEQAKLKKELARQKAEQAQRARVQKTNRETCAFWKETFSAEPTAYNKAMRDSSCKRAMQY